MVETGSTRAAAALLAISQPSVSEAIRSLETDLNVDLFAREGRRLVLNSAGATLAREAEAVLARLRLAEDRVRRSSDQPLRIGFVSAALPEVVPTLLRDLRRRGEAEPILAELTTPEQVSALSSGELDLGFLHPPVDLDPSSGLKARSLGRTPLCAALPADHRLAGQHAVTFVDLAREPLVLFPHEQGPSLRGVIDRMAFDVGAELKVVAEAARAHTQLSLVSGGLGAGLVLESVARVLSVRGVKFVRLADTQDRLYLELVAVGRATHLALLERFNL